MEPDPTPLPRSAWEVFRAFLRLGCTSFGGPLAHLGYFQAEFVATRHWLSPAAYAELVALCQSLPGPTSSEVGIAIGLSRAGYPGALAAWVGFTLPSAIILVLFGIGVLRAPAILGAGTLHGLQLAAVAVVAQALWLMAKSICTGRATVTIALLATTLVIWVPTGMGQILAIAGGGLLGTILLRAQANLGQTGLSHNALPVPAGRLSGSIALLLFAGLLVALPLLASQSGSDTLRVLDRFYRAGSLVFGGGHVVLPLLQTAVVNPGWVSDDVFLAGYGATQAMPGPLFTFAAYLGAVAQAGPGGWAGAAICLVAIFLPAFLLVIGILPFWGAVRRHPALQRAMGGVNAAVVGILLAALYHPLWTSAIDSAGDFAIAAWAYSLLCFWKLPSWVIVIACAVAGTLFAWLSAASV